MRFSSIVGYSIRLNEPERGDERQDMSTSAMT